ncbi:MAG: hypothetical protein LUQ07_05455 [Methanospirillum sp.]|nr:hypothetical protein [Methanospirillum sp.]
MQVIRGEELMGVKTQHVRIVRDEDIDWSVYHVITGEKGCTEENLMEWTGYDPECIRRSLERLERYHLINIRDNRWCACGIEEMLIKNRLQGCLSDGLELSGGIVRYRPSGEGKQ